MGGAEARGKRHAQLSSLGQGVVQLITVSRWICKPVDYSSQNQRVWSRQHRQLFSLAAISLLQGPAIPGIPGDFRLMGWRGVENGEEVFMNRLGVWNQTL